MAQQLMHTGQAWMCDYGTPSACFIGEVFHEPIGLSFNFAIAFLALRSAEVCCATGRSCSLLRLSVFMTFLVTLLLFKNVKAAAFAELLMALSPAVLVWAMPTNSDMAMLAYSLVAMFFLMVFIGEEEHVERVERAHVVRASQLHEGQRAPLSPGIRC